MSHKVTNFLQHLNKIDEEVCEELKIIPAKAVIVRHVRHIYTCRHCEESNDRVPMIKADMPQEQEWA